MIAFNLGYRRQRAKFQYNLAAATSSSDADRGEPSPDILAAAFHTAGVEVYDDVQELLENVRGTAFGRLLYGGS